MSTQQHEELMEIMAENKREIAALRSEVQPMVDIFKTVKFLGKWSGVMVAFFGTLIGLILGIKELFKKG